MGLAQAGNLFPAVAQFLIDHPASPFSVASPPPHQHRGAEGKYVMRYFDLNGDGKPDYFEESTPSGKLLTRWLDRNFDGKIDDVIYFPAQPGANWIHQWDSDFRGRVNQQEERSPIQDGLLVTLSQGLKPDGSFSRVEKFRIPRPLEMADPDHETQNQRPVLIGGSLSELESMPSLKPVLSKGKWPSVEISGFVSTPFGVKIHSSCAGKFSPDEIGEFIKETLRQGLRCLATPKSAGGSKHILEIAAWLADTDNPPKFGCLPPEHFALGDATMPGMDDHPRIRLNLSRIVKQREETSTLAREKLGRSAIPAPMPDSKTGKFVLKTLHTDDQRLIKNTIFHEIFHNLGYDHGSGAEAAFGCAACCFKAPYLGENAVQAACRICREEHPDVTSYNQDLMTLVMEETGMVTDVRHFLWRQLEQNPENPKLKLQVLTLAYPRPIQRVLIDDLKGKASTTGLARQDALKLKTWMATIPPEPWLESWKPAAAHLIKADALVAEGKEPEAAQELFAYLKSRPPSVASPKKENTQRRQVDENEMNEFTQTLAEKVYYFYYSLGAGDPLAAEKKGILAKLQALVGPDYRPEY